MDERCEIIGPKVHYLKGPNRCLKIKDHRGDCFFAPQIRSDDEHPTMITKKGERWSIVAFNQGGYDSTWVDLIDVLVYVKKHRPELLQNIPEI